MVYHSTIQEKKKKTRWPISRILFPIFQGCGYQYQQASEPRRADPLKDAVLIRDQPTAPDDPAVAAGAAQEA